MNLIEFDDILRDVEFSEELKVYTRVFLENVMEHLNDQIEQIKAEIVYRDDRMLQKKQFEGEHCSNKTCACNDEDRKE